MKWFLLLFLGVLSAAQENQVNIGSYLEDIGDLKIIDFYSKIDFSFGFDELIEESETLKTIVAERKFHCAEESCSSKYKHLLDLLNQCDINIKSIFKRRNGKRRSKRWDSLGTGLKYMTGVLDADDGRELQQEIVQLHIEQDNLAHKIEKVLDLSEQQESHDEDNFSFKVIDLNNKINSLAKTIITRQLDGLLVNIQEVDEKMKEIPLDDNHEIAFSSTLELMAFKLNDFIIDANEVKFSVNVPIVNSQNYTLYKIYRTPAKFNNYVAVVNFDSSYLAIGDDNVTFSLTNIESCSSRLNGGFVCDRTQIPNDECLSGIALQKTINMELCMNHILLAELPSAVMIENDFGEIWYNFEQHQDLEIVCEDETVVSTFFGFGVIDLQDSCSLKIGETYQRRNSWNNSDSSKFAIDISNTFEIDVDAPTLKNFKFYSMEKFKETAKRLDQLFVKRVELDDKLLFNEREIEKSNSEWNQSEMESIAYFVIGCFIALVFGKICCKKIKRYDENTAKIYEAFRNLSKTT